jgi:hypothetical protein
VRFFHPTGEHSKGRFKSLGDARAITFSPDGKTVNVASAYQWSKETEEQSDFRSVVLRWNTETGMELPPLEIQDGIIEYMAFPATKSEVLLTASNASSVPASTVVLWDVASGKQLGRHRLRDHTIDSMAFSAQGGWAFVGYKASPARPGENSLSYVQAISTRDRGQAEKAELRGLWEVGNKIGLYSLPVANAAARSFDQQAGQTGSPADAMAMSADSKILAVAHDGKRISLYRASPPHLAVRVGDLKDADYGANPVMAFTPDQRELLIASNSGIVRRYDVTRWTSVALTAEAPATNELDELVRLAQERFDIATKGAAVGLASPFEVIQAGCNLKDAQIRRAEARGEKQRMISHLEELVKLRKDAVEAAKTLADAGKITPDIVFRRQEELTNDQLRLKKVKE